MKPIETPFYFGASPEILKRASELRKNMNSAEKLLWSKLKSNQLGGYRFRAQHPISKFIVDFYCNESKLVIELDGDIHKNKIVAERDEGREYELEKLGLSILRFQNKEIIEDIEKVVSAIKMALSNKEINHS
jgi:very-short-patch-repair endonuclease